MGEEYLMIDIKIKLEFRKTRHLINIVFMGSETNLAEGSRRVTSNSAMDKNINNNNKKNTIMQRYRIQRYKIIVEQRRSWRSFAQAQGK